MESTWNSSLVREEAVGQRITYEGVSLEKYEKLYGKEELKREQESLEPTRRIERILKLAEKLPAEEKEEVKRLVKELRESS